MSKARILIVEDEFVVANDLRASLNSMGYTVTGIVASGERALERIRTEKPDLILMDIMLRGNMDGIETAEQIGSRFDIPVIFLTAHADQNVIDRAKRIEPLGYVIKPAEDRELEAAIEVAIYKVQMETYRKQMEEEVLKVRKLESMSVFAGGIAHDYNNLLTAIMGYISLAQMHTEPEGKLFKLLTEAEKAALRARDLTKQLSAFYRGEMTVKRTVSILPLLRNIIKLALKDSDIKCEFFVSDDLWYCEIDEIQISEAIHNIIINAREAMPRRGTIQITVQNFHIDEKNDFKPFPTLNQFNYIKISIKDQGKGISEADIGKIFDPYFSTKERGAQKGMGLGLTISHSILKRHNGHIAVESEKGSNTTFNIYLPASKETLPPKDKKIIKSPQSFLTVPNKRVLVMDDEKIIRDVAGHILEHLGYETEFAEDGDKVIDLYKKAKQLGDPFDAIILDLVVPNGMGGKETIEKLKEIDPDVRVIISSGYSDDPVMTNYKEYGFDGVVAKPYKVNELSMVLQNVVNSDTKKHE